MSYLVYRSDGTAVTIADNQINTQFYNPTGGGGTGGTGNGQGIQLLGKFTVGYGAAMAQNLIQIVENFSSNIIPADGSSLQGQLWFNQLSNTSGALNVRFTTNTAGGGANWKQIVTYDGALSNTSPYPSSGTITATFNGPLSGNATSATTASNISGGLANQVLYQTAPGATGFINAPTVAGTTLTWNGSAFIWNPAGVGTVTSVSVAGGPGISTSGSPITTSGTITVNNTGVLSITGTANQIAASSPTGNVTLSFPQNVIIPTPGSGVALSVSGASGQSVIQLTTSSFSPAINIQGPASTQIGALNFSQSGQTAWQFYQPASSSDFRIYGGRDTLIINNAGNVTIDAPVSGANLTLPGPGGLESDGPIEVAGRAYSGPSYRMRDCSAGLISFYDDVDPDAGVFNYTISMDADVFAFAMSTVNSPYDYGTNKVTIDSTGSVNATGNVNGVGGSFSGNVTGVTRPNGDNTTSYATTQFVQTAVVTAAPSATAYWYFSNHSNTGLATNPSVTHLTFQTNQSSHNVTYSSGTAVIGTTGTYFVSAQVSLGESAGGSGLQVAAYIYHGATQISATYFEHAENTTTNATLAVSAVVACNAGDTIDIRASRLGLDAAFSVNGYGCFSGFRVA